MILNYSLMNIIYKFLQVNYIFFKSLKDMKKQFNAGKPTE